MNPEAARLKIAELVSGEFERQKIDPLALAQTIKSVSVREGLWALLSGEESKNAVHGAAEVLGPLSIQPQVMAELFQEAYPVLDFKPRLSFGSAGLGVGFDLIAPEELDVMKMVDAMVVGVSLKQFYIFPTPYLRFGGYKRDPNLTWNFSAWGTRITGRERWPTPLAERPPEANTPYWFGHTEHHNIVCASPDGAWVYERKET